MIARALVAAALVAAAASLAGACAGGRPETVELSEAWPARAGDYQEVTRRWTRHARKRSGPDPAQGRILDQTLDVVATFKSPEWRAAYVRRRAETNRLPQTEVAALVEREKKDAADHYEVMLLVATYDRRLNELQKGERSIWRLALVDGSGAEVVASEIRRDRRPRSEIAADFPEMGDFHQPYVARFPHKIDLLRPGAGKFSLRLTSTQAGVELVWAEARTAAR